jgi:hypothetical protein
MADKNIPDITATAVGVTSSDLFEIYQGSVNKKISPPAMGISYTNPLPTTISVGGIPAGSTFFNTPKTAAQFIEEAAFNGTAQSYLIDKGLITLAADFPTLVDVKAGWLYRFAAIVIDNDATKTNTGQAFIIGDEAYWNGASWEILGKARANEAQSNAEDYADGKFLSTVLQSNIVIIDQTNGNDTTGVPGDLSKPFKNYNAAALQVTPVAYDNYIASYTAGAHAPLTLTLKPYFDIQGAGLLSTILATQNAPISLDASFATQDSNITIDSVALGQNGLNCDLATLGGNFSASVFLRKVLSAEVNHTFNGRHNDEFYTDTFVFDNCYISEPVTVINIDGGSVVFSNTLFLGGTLNLAATSVHLGTSITGGSLANVNISGGSATINNAVEITNSPIKGTLTIDGIHPTVSIDEVSLSTAILAFTGGATAAQITYASKAENIKGSPLQLANLTALVNYNNLGQMVVGMLGTAQDTGIVYKLTTKLMPGSHVWTTIAPLYTSEIINDSGVAGTTASDALNTLNNQIGVSASAAVSFYLDDTNIIPAGTQSLYEVVTLSKTPVTTAEVQDQIIVNNNTVLKEAYLYPTELGGSQIEGGAWWFNLWRSASLTVGTSQILINVMQVISQTATVTITGTAGTATRTATASAGTVFVAGDANADITISSYLKTPNGFFQIVGYTSPTEVTIAVPTTYNNESSVAFTKAARLFQTTTGEINDTTLTLQQISSFQGTFAISALDKLMVIYFGRTTHTNNVTLTFTHNGSTRYSSFSTPLITRHNDLAGLQSAAANVTYGHVTDGAQTIAGAKTFSSPPVLSSLAASELLALDGSKNIIGITNLPASIVISLNNQVDNYTLALTDTNKLVEINYTTTKTVTVPTNLAVPFPIGAIISVIQQGVGQVVIAGDTGVTIRSAATLLLRTQYSGVTLTKRATDEWYLTGDLQAA